MSKKVLFICQGNVGRSQMAEGYYNHFSNSQDANSAGVSDVGHKYNYKPTDLIVEVMKEDSVDVAQQKVKQVNLDMIDDVEQVVVLCEKDICPNFIQESSKVLYYKITDPYQAGEEATRIIRNEIKTLVLSLLE